MLNGEANLQIPARAGLEVISLCHCHLLPMREQRNPSGGKEPHGNICIDVLALLREERSVCGIIWGERQGEVLPDILHSDFEVRLVQ